MNILHKALLPAAAFAIGAALSASGIAAAAEPVAPARSSVEKAPKPATLAPAQKQPMKRATPGTALPDLTIVADSVVVTPPTPLAGSPDMPATRIEASVRNIGTAEARNFTVVFVLKRGTTHIGQIGRTTVASLPAGGSTTASATVGANFLPTAGAYELSALVDVYPTSVAESDERNNSAEKPLTIIGPDFAVSGADIEITPATPAAGDTITVRAPFRNHGTGRGVEFVRLSLVDSGGRVLAQDSSAIEVPAGGFVFVTKRFTVPAGSGDYAVRCESDRDNRNKEANESDNLGEKFFSVRAR